MCSFRHYDFEQRADMITSWKPGVVKKRRASFKQLESAKKLKQAMERKYDWLIQAKEKKPDKPEIVKNVDAMVLNKKDFRVMMALLSQFATKKNDDLDYYAIGKLAMEHLRWLNIDKNESK